MSKSLALASNWEMKEYTPHGPRDKYNVVALDTIHEDGIKMLESDPRIQVEDIKKSTKEILIDLFKRTGDETVHGIIYRSETDKLLKNNPEILDYVTDTLFAVRAGIGVGTPSDRAAMNGIQIMRTPEANRQAVHAYVMNAIETMFTPFEVMNAVMHKGESWHKVPWSKEELKNGLKGKKIFVWGAGGIGARVLQSCYDVGAEVMFYDPFVPSVTLKGNDERKDVTIRCLDHPHDGLREASMTSLNISGEDEVFGMDEAKLIKGGFVNTARGDCVSPEALEWALNEGELLMAHLDVHAQENAPLYDNTESLDLSNIVSRFLDFVENRDQGLESPVDSEAEENYENGLAKELLHKVARYHGIDPNMNTDQADSKDEKTLKKAQLAQAARRLVDHKRVTSTSHVCAKEKSAESKNGTDAAEKMIRALYGGVVNDGWNVANMPQIEEIFRNGPTSYILSVMNADVTDVHDNVDEAIENELGDVINKGNSSVRRSFTKFSFTLDDENHIDNNAEKYKVATRLIELDLDHPDPEILQKMVSVASQIEGVFKARLFKYERQQSTRLSAIREE